MCRPDAARREILDLVAEGKTNGQIAEQLWISGGTVRRHLENTFAKLGVHTRTAAVRAASLGSLRRRGRLRSSRCASSAAASTPWHAS